MQKELKVEAKTENLKKVVSFLQDTLSGEPLSPGKRKQIRLCAEEIFMNITRHAYREKSGTALIRADFLKDRNPRQTEISFIDDGPPFDPLAMEEPDLGRSLEETPIGGLGIFLVRTMTDQIQYEYKNGQNVLTIRINEKDVS